MLYWQSLLPDSWHHDRLPSMSCSIDSLSSLIPGIPIAFPQCHALLAVSLSYSWHHDRLPSVSCSIGILSSLIPGITIAFLQCHALLTVSLLSYSWHHDRLPQCHTLLAVSPL